MKHAIDFWREMVFISARFGFVPGVFTQLLAASLQCANHPGTAQSAQSAQQATGWGTVRLVLAVGLVGNPTIWGDPPSRAVELCYIC